MSVIAPLVVVPVASMAPAFTGYMVPILKKEGGSTYTNDPNDRGGPTKYGVTEARARASGYQGDMRDLTFEQAMTIYWLFFWLQPKNDKINLLSSTLAATMLDLGINFGAGAPGLWLQQTLNVLNNQASCWPDITEDGAVGLMTVAALDALKRMRGPDSMRVMDESIRALAFGKYFGIMRADPTQEKYGWGWISQRAFPPRVFYQGDIVKA